jgi:MFS family permease
MDAEPHPVAGRPLAAFAVPNFRRFVTGQTISLIGSWTETVAQAVLVLRLTHSGVWLGLSTAARYAPVLLLTPYAGVIVDRRAKRRLLLFTQSSLAAASVVLGALVLSGAVRLWMVFAVALVFGTLTAFDNPARLAFISEMVGERLIRNAVTLNSTLVNVGRALGPIGDRITGGARRLPAASLRTRAASSRAAAAGAGLRADGSGDPRPGRDDGADRHSDL